MAKIENLIRESLKERLQEVTSKPKRRRLGKQIIASSNKELEVKCRQLRSFEYKEMQEKSVPVLFMFGQPYQILTKEEAKKYRTLGMRIENMKYREVQHIKK